MPSKVRMPRLRWLARDRLDRRLDELWQRRLGLVVAPAGSGKTTLLVGWATAARDGGARVAWYRAEGTDGDPATLLEYLRAAIAEAVGPDLAGSLGPAPWRSVEAAARALEALPPGRLLLAIDDLHTLAGSAAELALEAFLDYTGPGLALVAATRSVPRFNLSRRRVSDSLLEITGDDLRFRPWEVDTLFRDFYGESLRGDELARLARRTEGWAAGLQLFHLATRGKPPAERARVLDGLATGSRLLREYLARNVVDELPADLRTFLVETCVLRRLSGPLCDRLLGRSTSARLLEELERRQVFTVSIDGNGTYRYHEVLRGYLEGLLVDARGEAGARAWSARAGALLEADGAVAEALAAYCRAEAWDAAARVIGTGGAQLASTGSGAWSEWLDAVPRSLLQHDPWLILATARRLRADGEWSAAVEAYGQAEAAFGAADAALTCRRERLALAAFVDPMARPGGGWPGALRMALTRDPLRVGAPPDGTGRARPGGSAGSAGDGLAEGLALLVAGRPASALAALEAATGDAGAPAVVGAAATLAGGVARVLAGADGAERELERAVAQAEAAGQPWLTAVGRAALGLVQPAALPDTRKLGERAAHSGDAWGALIAALVEAWAGLEAAGDDAAALEAALRAAEAADASARRLGAGSLGVWARALAALATARLGLPTARDAALAVDSLARAVGVQGVRAVVHAALAAADPDGAGEHAAMVAAVAHETGLRAPGTGLRAAGGAGEPAVPDPGAAAGAAAGPGAGPAAVEIRLLGGFAVAIGGRELSLAAIKPRPRAILRLLALNAGRPLHREVLAATFWPEADPETAARNLHVALSGLRRELGALGSDGLVVRQGDAYRLALPPGSRVDLVDLEAALAEGRAARARGDAAGATERFRAALTLGEAELLPEDGPAEWVVARREAARAEAAEAARALAELLLADDPSGAADAAARGLRVDPYSDALWRLLVDGRERAGDAAAAASARLAYARTLASLGIVAEGAGEAAAVPGRPAAAPTPSRGTRSP